MFRVYTPALIFIIYLDLNKEFIFKKILCIFPTSQKEINIPLPPKPEEVFKVIGRVANEHEVTAEDMVVAMALRASTPGGEISSADISTYSELRDSKK